MTGHQTSSPVAPTMLLTFRVENVRSFRDPAELSFVATAIAERDTVRHISWRDGGATIGVLPVACIFGANASGKSNVLKAMDDMRRVVMRSFRAWSPTGRTERRPFRLDRASPQRPSRFEVDLVMSGVRHEYGFVLDDDAVIEEWAVRYPKGKAALVFRRTGMDIRWGTSVPAAKSRAVGDLVRPNALVVSTGAAAGHPDLLPLYEWFSRNLRLAEADSRHLRHAFSAQLMTQPGTREQVMALLHAADLGIVGVTQEEVDPQLRERLEKAVRVLAGDDDADASPAAEGLMLSEVRFHHAGEGDDVAFAPADESLGTLVWLGLVGPIVDALSSGAVLLADELDSSLHPALTAQVVRLFQDPETNPHRAQLVINSHDVTLLDELDGHRLLGRDQVWFTEKRNDGASVLFPLADLDPRKHEAVGRRYLAGHYGGRPILADGDFTAAAQLILAGAGGR